MPRAILLCLAVLALAACQLPGLRAVPPAASLAAAGPGLPPTVFPGLIEPLTEPVLIRYRAFAPAPFTGFSSSTLVHAGHVQMARGALFGTVEAVAAGAGVRYVFQLRITEPVGDGERTFETTVRATLSEQGALRDIEIADAGGPPGAAADGAPTAEEMRMLVEMAAPVVPAGPVSTGDTLYEIRTTGLGLPARIDGTVLGRTVVRGRPALVVGLDGSIGADRITGFALVDIETGASLRSETAGTLSVGGWLATMTFRSAQAIGL